MKTTRVNVTEKPVGQVPADLLVFFASHEKQGAPRVPGPASDAVETAFDLGDFSGKEGETLQFYPGPGKAAKALRLLVMGLGKPGKKGDVFSLRERLRKIGGDLAGICAKTKAKTLTLALPKPLGLGPDVDIEAFAQSLTEGILLGDYQFEKYKETTLKKDGYTGLSTLTFAGGKPGAPALRKGVKKGKAAARIGCTARDMANEPGNGWTSKEFADHAAGLAKEFGLTYKCMEKKEMEKLGMGGILAVNQGSALPPRMVILEYKTKKKADTLLLVGKGITFDSGGISIKPAANMGDMKYDMCGGAAVLSVMAAVGMEKPDLNVVAIVPATDNMSGSGAVRPGDIIRHFNKVTSEIVNTDAEGRMILGDALAYGIKTYTPDCVVDIATLTGAVVIGLGHHFTGMMSNDDDLSRRLITAGDGAGEPIWRLPITEAYQEQIKSHVADIKNTGGRAGGSITAGAYLSKFVGETPWAHLDIAGTAWDFTKKSYIPKGPSGIGARTFLELIRNWEKRS